MGASGEFLLPVHGYPRFLGGWRRGERAKLFDSQFFLHKVNRILFLIDSNLTFQMPGSHHRFLRVAYTSVSEACLPSIRKFGKRMENNSHR